MQLPKPKDSQILKQVSKDEACPVLGVGAYYAEVRLENISQNF